MKKFLALLLVTLAILVSHGQIQVVTLVGNGSDSDGTVSKSEWLALSNPSATVFGTPIVTYTTAVKSVIHTTTVVPAGGLQWLGGVYKFVFRVTDNAGGIANDTMQVTFKVNVAPKANAGPDQSVTLPNGVAIGGRDVPVDGLVRWSKLYGGNAVFSDPHASFTKVSMLQPGFYMFKKTVYNSQGQSASDLCVVLVRQYGMGQFPTNRPNEEPRKRSF